jgi:hypothetical protein
LDERKLAIIERVLATQKMSKRNKNVISAVLFGTEGRYWFNVPQCIISNLLMYPEFTFRLHISKSCQDYKLYPMLEKLKETGRFELLVLDRTYSGLEPTTWRIMPLYDEDVQILICRDIDSNASSLDAKAVNRFIRNERFFMHSLRTYPSHTRPLMAGLCGFNASNAKLREKLGFNFEFYRDFGLKRSPYCQRNWEWGCDQELLEMFFVGHIDGGTGFGLLDFPVHGSERVASLGFRSSILQPEVYQNDSINVPQEIIDICDKNCGKFIGACVNSWGRTGEDNLRFLNDLLNLNNELCKKLKDIFQETLLKEYYHVL